MVGIPTALLRRRAGTVRTIAWLTLIPVLGVYAIARESATRIGNITQVLVFLIPVVLAFAGVLSASIVAPRGSTERRFWGAFGVATSFLLASETSYAAYQLMVDMRGPAAPSLFDALNFAAAITFVILFSLLLARSPRSRPLATARNTAVLFALAAPAYAAVYRWVAAPLVAATGRGAQLGAVWAAYIFVGVLLLTGAIVALLLRREVRTSAWQVLVSVALAAYGVAVLLWPAWYVGQAAPGDSLPDLSLNAAYMVGYHLLFMASLYWSTSESPKAAGLLASVGYQMTPRGMIVVTTATLASLPVLVWWVDRAPSGSVSERLYFGVATLVTLAVVVRTALADVESSSLKRYENRDLSTGVLNRRGFDARLIELLNRSAARGAPLSLVVLDIDDFARFNVMHGRASGDAALGALAATLSAGLGSREGVVGRLGGDEFVVALPDCDKTAGLGWAKEAVGGGLAPPGVPGQVLRVSGGVATAPEDGREPSVLVERADGALGWAKYRGKHRIAGFDEEVEKSLDAEERIRIMARKSRLDIVRALAAATDARDAATAYHSRQVAALAALVCERLGMDEERVREIQTAALLHDIGKVAVPDSVLRKRARLSPGERAVLREHADLGARILEATELRHMAPWVRGHHERWDGTGYPEGLVGDEVPFEARVIAACNLYDQIVSGGPERGPLSRSAALQEIDQSMGGAMDPRVAEALIEVVSGSRSLGWSGAWLS